MKPQVRFIKDVLKEVGCPEAKVRWKESRSLGAIWFDINIFEDHDWAVANLREGNPAVEKLKNHGLQVWTGRMIGDVYCHGSVRIDDIDTLKMPESYGNPSTHLE